MLWEFGWIVGSYFTEKNEINTWLFIIGKICFFHLWILQSRNYVLTKCGYSTALVPVLVTQFVNQFAERWIDRSSPIYYTSRSPDMTPLDFPFEWSTSRKGNITRINRSSAHHSWSVQSICYHSETMWRRRYVEM